MAGPAPGTIQQQQASQQPAPAAPDYQKDYWAQDRPQVLASMGLQDTSGKTWNGSTWVAGGTAAPSSSSPSSPYYGSYTQVGGYDTSKLNDPNKHDPKYDWERAVQAVSGNGSTVDVNNMQGIVDYYNKTFGQYDPAASYVGKDIVNFGNGFGNVDVVQGYGSGQNLPFWNPVGGTSGGGSATSGSPYNMNGTMPTNLPPGAQTLGANGMPGVNGFSTSASDYNLPSAGGLPSGAPGDLYSTLMQRAGQSLNVSPNDPIIRAQTDAYDAAQQRSRRNYLNDLAEKAGPNANLGTESRMTAENAGQATGQLRASLMQNELTARRGEIQNALTQMGSMLSDQQKIALQQELGLIDASLRQQQINSGNDQFMAQLGLNAQQQANYWDWIRSGGQA